MLNKNLLKKVSLLAVAGAVLAVSVLPFVNGVSSQAVAATPKFEITTSVDKQQADRGEVLNYTVNAKNTGDVELTNTKVWFSPLNLATLEAGSGTYTRTSTGVTKTITDDFLTVSNNFGNVPAGQSVVLKFRTKVADNANMDNIIWVVANGKSDQTSQVIGEAWTRVILKNPALCAEKTADKKTVEIGDTVTFTIKVCNKGNIILNNVMIGDIIQSPFRYVNGSAELRMDNQVTKVEDKWLQYGFRINYLNPGQDAFLTFKTTVSNEMKNGQTLQNVAQVKSDETPNIIKCPVYLKGKVLGITKTPEKPTELPNTGAGEMLLLAAGLIPAGWALKRFKSKI